MYSMKPSNLIAPKGDCFITSSLPSPVTSLLQNPVTSFPVLLHHHFPSPQHQPLMTLAMVNIVANLIRSRMALETLNISVREVLGLVN